MEMGEKIKMLRKQRGLTLEQIGDRVGVGKSTVRKWEEGAIKNMRRDKIASLAIALGTTPEYLMGWPQKEDPWTSQFRSSLAHVLEVSNQEDMRAAGIDVEHLSAIADGAFSLSLSEACNVADQLGCTLDELVSPNKKEPSAENDEELKEAMTIFRALSADNRSKLLELSRLYLDAQHKTQGNQ